MIDILLDTILDILRILPFLFGTYLFLEWLETHAEHRFVHILEKHHRLGPLFGSLLGLVPECGFSSASSNLYTTGIIHAGTLIAVYLSTSDEMLPIMLSSHTPWSKILPILCVKLITACLAGYLVYFLVPKKKRDIDSFCEREHCECEKGILHSALKHTLTITAWLFVITLILNGIIELAGMDSIRNLVIHYPNKSLLLCTLIGIIPNCASSITLTTLYLENVIPFGAVCAGLLANAGIGLLVLFRVNPDWKANLKISGFLIVVSLAAGMIIQIFA